MQRYKTTKVFESDFVEMKATIETNCPAGGDAGHGGATLVCIKSSTGIELHPELEFEEIHFAVLGDDEAYTLARVLRWLGYELEAMLATNAECREMEGAER